MADVAGGELQLSVGEDTIVVFDSTALIQIRDGEPVVETELNDGIIFVQPWTGTGAVTSGEPEAFEGLGCFDPSSHLSPDGRTVVYRSHIDGSGRRRILDVATGNSITADRIDRALYPDSWATDSSGLFFADGEGRRQDDSKSSSDLVIEPRSGRSWCARRVR